MKTGSFIGIDFGSTDTSVVCVRRDEKGVRVSVLGEEGEYPFASLLAISEDNKVFFGNKVRRSRAQLSDSHTLAKSLKSLLGTDETVTVNGKACSPRQITAEYFRCLKRVIAKRYNIDVKEAAVSYPADLAPEARRDLAEAAKKADIKLTGFLSEPLAAYLSESDALADKKRVLSVNWGGSTLGVSVLTREDGKVGEELLLTEKIGGDDIDAAIAAHVHSMFGELLEDKSKAVRFDDMPASERDKMLLAAERAKIKLSEGGGEFPLTISDYGAYGTRTAIVTGDILDKIAEPIIKERVVGAVERALKHAGLSADEPNAVIVSGGSGSVRGLVGALSGLFGGDKVTVPERPQFASAVGAAACCYSEGRFLLEEDLGVVMSDGTLFPMLKKDADGIGSKSAEFTFSAVEDTNEAHVIIASGSGRIYERISVPIKGFLCEKLRITAGIDDSHTLRIRVIVENSPEDRKEKVYSANGLTFLYAAE